jgi:hypothetical protein
MQMHVFLPCGYLHPVKVAKTGQSQKHGLHSEMKQHWTAQLCVSGCFATTGLVRRPWLDSLGGPAGDSIVACLLAGILCALSAEP